MRRAIRNDKQHKVSRQDYGSLTRQNETLASFGISPTSRGSEDYDPDSDPFADKVGEEVEYDPGLIKELKKYRREKGPPENKG